MSPFEGTSNSSGARYGIEQFCAASSCKSSASVRLEMCRRAVATEPKSISTGTSPSETRTLAGLMSRCAQGGECEWSCCTPSSTCKKIRSARASSIRFPVSISLRARSSNVPCGYSGISRRNSSAPLDVWTIEWSIRGMRFGCLNDLCTCTSQRASSDASGSCASTFFRAYRFLSGPSTR
eukprot:scaffold13561_cov129-Isochrysis_galbana.AAC.1